ncbi:MAG: bifunctional heptose 7-phosphate kinase/heptose 1-phosphate adenyltransferase [Phycisphaerae bacterium]|nr:bifunctional heptose 7-phosphate kinase/heptose 1-phosphate adenyltransferase [Phycisphaerae bacterium]HAW95782.1 bifunctional heptose 7-phosphate kinase/heptose 1-phosphate adenyltransferase [Phycisphaerales bacterium]
MNTEPNKFVRLLEALEGFRSFDVVLVGDFMLDQQVQGAAERLSPEAPIPILRATSHRDVTSTPGGSGNVANCLAALGAQVRCFGVVGDDPEGALLTEMLSDEGCDVSGFVIDGQRPTTVKRSLVGLAQHRHPQKMFRLDFESSDPLSSTVSNELIERIERALDSASIVCIEDYAKGVCTESICQAVIKAARARGIPVLVDPAPIKSYERYSGATLVTPNRSEAELATGSTAPGSDQSGVQHGKALAKSLLENTDIDSVAVTVDKDGAIIASRGGELVHVPTRARTVYDVTGAGDMVLAALAGCLAHDMSLEESMQVANIAAGLEVETFGVRPIPLGEIRRSLLLESGHECPPLLELSELLEDLGRHREQCHRIVLTNGCFDVIHAGHVAYLRDARREGDVLVVGVNSDAQVRALKGESRPIFNQVERVEILGELKCVDYLVIFEEHTAHDLIRAVMPDIYVKGGDYEPDQIVEYDLLAELGIDVKVLAHRPGLGSSALIDRIRTES